MVWAGTDFTDFADLQMTTISCFLCKRPVEVDVTRYTLPCGHAFHLGCIEFCIESRGLVATSLALHAPPTSTPACIRACPVCKSTGPNNRMRLPLSDHTRFHIIAAADGMADTLAALSTRTAGLQTRIVALKNMEKFLDRRIRDEQTRARTYDTDLRVADAAAQRQWSDMQTTYTTENIILSVARQRLAAATHTFDAVMAEYRDARGRATDQILQLQGLLEHSRHVRAVVGPHYNADEWTSTSTTPARAPVPAPPAFTDHVASYQAMHPTQAARVPAAIVEKTRILRIMYHTEHTMRHMRPALDAPLLDAHRTHKPDTCVFCLDYHRECLGVFGLNDTREWSVFPRPAWGTEVPLFICCHACAQQYVRFTEVDVDIESH